MKIACERCNKVMNAYLSNEYKKIRINDDNEVLCKECYEKLMDWMYKSEE